MEQLSDPRLCDQDPHCRSIPYPHRSVPLRSCHLSGNLAWAGPSSISSSPNERMELNVVRVGKSNLILHLILEKENLFWESPNLQLLRPYTSTAGRIGSIPGGRTKIPYAVQCNQKKTEINKTTTTKNNLVLFPLWGNRYNAAVDHLF